MSLSTLDTMAGSSTGTVVVTDPLNFWAGKRVKPRQEKPAESVFEPATGEYCTIKLFNVFRITFSLLVSVVITRRTAYICCETADTNSETLVVSSLFCFINLERVCVCRPCPVSHGSLWGGGGG